jgi:hypothetical protein
MQAVRRTPGTRDQTQPMPSYPKIPRDTAGYERQVRADSSAGRCFICSMHENGYLDIPEADLAEVARRIREQLQDPAR